MLCRAFTFFLHQRARDLGSTCVNGHVGYGSLGFKHKTCWPTRATVAVVDTGADTSSAPVGVDMAEHDHDACVMPRIV
jgi:hypothetical protein